MFRTGQAFHSKGNINNRRYIDTLRQRRGNLRLRGKTDDESEIWVRSRGGQMEGDGWDSRYNIFQLYLHRDLISHIILLIIQQQTLYL